MRSPIGPIGTLWAIVVLSIGACGSAESGAPDRIEPRLEESGEWVLLTMGEPDNPAPIATKRLTTITFTEGELTGAAPCNRYRASYTLDNDQLVIGPIAATGALCGDPALDAQEAAYLQALDTATALTIDADNTLTVTYGPGNQLRYQAA